MNISSDMVKKLREMSGAPMMECKKALEEGQGNIEEAYTILRKRGQAAAAKKEGRATKQGLIGSYVHQGAQLAVIVEVNCESDFVARNQEFQELAHDLAMQICATDPRFVRKEDVSAEVLDRERTILRDQAKSAGKPDAVVDRMVEGRLAKFYEDYCLYEQHFIKDQASAQTIRELINAKIAKFGENIAVRRFARFKVGEGMGSAGSDGSAAGS
ncbi:MAG TPA: translation elongation factor Ts [Terriglobia bacterium]|nr:translation elongation factor Ts [Terriglobia bacterium]